MKRQNDKSTLSHDELQALNADQLEQVNGGAILNYFPNGIPWLGNNPVFNPIIPVFNPVQGY